MADAGDRFPRPIATVDVVLLTLVDEKLNVALYRRATEPFVGQAALPGGYVRIDQDVDLDATAARILVDKADLAQAHLEQLQTFSGRDRDPRGWSISAAYVAVVPLDHLSGGPGLEFRPVDRASLDLPFDHGAIVEAAVDRVRSKSIYSTLPMFAMPDEFTIAELRDVYRVVLGLDRLDLAGFRKKILDLGAIDPIDGAQRTGAHRPAQLYRRATPEIATFDRTI